MQVETVVARFPLSAVRAPPVPPWAQREYREFVDAVAGGMLAAAASMGSTLSARYLLGSCDRVANAACDLITKDAGAKNTVV